MGRRKKIKTSASDHFDIGLIGRIQLEKQLDSLEPNMKKKRCGPPFVNALNKFKPWRAFLRQLIAAT